MISIIDFRYDQQMKIANEKYLAKWTAAKMFIIKCFHSTLRITTFRCRAVPEDRFEVRNHPTCTKIGFSIITFP